MDVVSPSRRDAAESPQPPCRSARRWFRCGLAVVLGLLALHLIWVHQGVGGEFGVLVFTDVESGVLALISALACAFAGLRSTGRTRHGWLLLAAGMAAWSAGDAIWTWYEVVLGVEAPFPSIADAAYLAMVPLSVAGFARMIQLRRRALRILFDGLIVSISLAIVSWPFVLGPTLEAGGDTPFAFGIAVAYPVGDIVIATMAFILLGQSRSEARGALGLAGAGMLSFAVADSGFAYLVLTDAYGTGSPIDVGWVIGFLLVGLAGLRAGLAPPPGNDESGPGSLLVALPYLPLAAAITTGVTMRLVHGREPIEVYAAGVTVVVLVVVRQFLTVRENLLLTERLAGVVDDLRRREEELRRLAFHDPLTGLANRALFQHETERAVNSQSRTSALIGLVYLDLDGFKAVNDTLGHAAGDALLVAVGRRLRECIRPGDTVARLGGDEFAMLLEYFTPARGEADAVEVAQRAVAKLSEPFLVDGQEVRIGASAGVAVAAPGGGEAGVLVRDADLAMYAAKLAGKGRVVLFEGRMRDQIVTAAAA